MFVILPLKKILLESKAKASFDSINILFLTILLKVSYTLYVHLRIVLPMSYKAPWYYFVHVLL